MGTHAKLIKQMNAVASDLPPPLKREVEMVMHKMTYPMTDILAKVPGETVSQKAKKLRVSRQTVYVWMSERFRPTLEQATRIAKYADVPVEHIIENGFEDADTRRAARKEAARLADNRKKVAQRKGRAASRRRSAIIAKRLAKSVGSLHQPTGG